MLNIRVLEKLVKYKSIREIKVQRERGRERESKKKKKKEKKRERANTKELCGSAQQPTSTTENLDDYMFTILLNMLQ